MKFKELNFIAKLDLREFLQASQQVAAEDRKTRSVLEKPVKPDLDANPIKLKFLRIKDEEGNTRKRVEKPFELKEIGAADIVKNIVAIGAAYLGVQSAQESFRRFQTNLTNVSTLGVENINELKTGVLQLAVDTPVALESLEKGLYDVVSAGVDAANQLTVLELSARGAKAGVAETADSLGLASAVIKAYNKDWSETEGILDRAFKTVELGSTTFKDLATNVQNVTPVASALNISVNELFGAFATLTGVTGNTSIVSTQLRSIFTELARPTEGLSKLIRNLGFSSVEAAAKSEGLAGILQILQRETGGSAAAMSKLFSSSESLTALLALTGSQYDNFVEKTNKVTNATGAMGSAFDKQSETLDSRLQLLRNRFEVITIGLLEGTLPALNVVVDAVSKVVGSFASLDTASQQTILGITGLSVVLVKLPAIIAAVRTAIAALNASLGPAGWLILGVGAAASAFIAFTDSASSAAKANDVLTNSNIDLGDSLEDVERKALSAAKALSYEQLLAKRQEIIGFIAQQNEELTRLQNESETNPFSITDQDFADSKKRIQDASALLKSINQQIIDLEVEQKSSNLRKIEEQRKLNEEEQKELDKLREYQFQTNRLTLAEYIEYLNSRKAAQAQALGDQSVEFLQFTDKIAELQNRLNTESVATLDVEVRTPDLDQFEEFLGEYYAVEADFREQGFQDLLVDYNTKQLLFDNNLDYLREKYGEESDIYQRELKRREQMQRNFNTARINLEAEAMKVIAGLGNQLMAVFAGQSKVLFDIGKGLSIANATISTYEAVTRAYKDYPWPFNLAIAAIQAGLGFAQVAKISGTEYSAEAQPVGFATGGKITQADILQTFLTPPGEDGIIGIQKGEFVVNKKSTEKYQPIIEAINQDTFDKADGLEKIGMIMKQSRRIQAFSEGGLVDEDKLRFTNFATRTNLGTLGFAGVDPGDFIVSRKQSIRYLDILEQINKGEYSVPSAAATAAPDSNFAGVNVAGSVPVPPESAAQFNAALLEDAFINAIEKSRFPKLSGTLTAQGKELQTALDKLAELKRDI